MFWVLGIVGILGMPPFGIFFSKFYIIFGFFQAEHPWLGILLLVLLAGMLIGILYHVMRMFGGHGWRKCAGELLGGIDSVVLGVLLLTTCIVSAGLGEIPVLQKLLTTAAQIVMGGAY